jgi:hypothetical protein
MTRPERRYVTTTAILLALVAMFSFAQWMGWIGE